MLIFLIFFHFAGKESPDKIIKKYIIDPIPPGLKIISFNSIRGVAGSIRIYKVQVDEKAIQSILLDRSKYLVDFSDRKKIALKKILEECGRFEVETLSGFRLYQYDVEYNVGSVADSVTIQILVGESTMYFIISR